MAAITTAIIGVASLAATAYGMSEQRRAASSAADAQANIAAQERYQESVRRQAMELEARRRKIELFRNMQQARAQSLAAATNQGAGLGSGLAGAYGQMSGDYNTNALSIDQNLAQGNQIFNSNSLVSDYRMQLGSANAQSAFGSSMMGLGNSLLSNAGTINRIGQGFNFGSNSYGYSSSNNSTYGGTISNIGRGGIY